ncbi:MAG: transketolase [Acidobacteriota bacterium]|nr:transketolase [Acidobacteriota bacterium]
MSQAPADLDELAINTLRFLAVDMVEKANSGHPGAPMGQAPLAYLLWTRHLRHDPAAPDWPDRDRFVLSCGHASALLYGLLHLSGYDLPLAELQRFRQLGSRTPGHPERGHTPGVETTTGPLGQGLASAVGMAIAKRMLAAEFNRTGFELFTHRVIAIASDGDLMEGVASEACSLAGHLGLADLKVFYDANRISIDGSTDLAFTEDVGRRFEAYGWRVLEVADVNDLDATDGAISEALAESRRPTLVVVRTHIGYGSPAKQDSAAAHGSPLGADETAATKERLGWPAEPAFHVPEAARQPFVDHAGRGAVAHSMWRALLREYGVAHPEPAAELARRRACRLPDDWERALPSFDPAAGAIATRKASGVVLNALAGVVRELVGGSADLTGSNNTFLEGVPVFDAREHGGRNLYFGVREHGMAAAVNGMALSGLLRPYCGTFLIFSDYMRPAIRLAALMGLPSIFVFTHDSIFLGEDGPTHQPISQLLSLRSIPNLTVIRPADANETAGAWRAALANRSGPTAIVLTRQKLAILSPAGSQAAARGAYVLTETADEPRLSLLASGSEVALALDAAQVLTSRGVASRVVSMPSWELFDAQDAGYRASVLPDSAPLRLAIEAGSPLGWERYVGDRGRVLGVDGYGASAPQRDLAEHYGFTVENVVAQALAMLS